MLRNHLVHMPPSHGRHISIDKVSKRRGSVGYGSQSIEESEFFSWSFNYKYPKTGELWWEKEQNLKRKYRGQQIIKNKENVLNQIKEIENNFTISINTERNLRASRAIAAIKKNRKYFFKLLKKTLNGQAKIGPL